MAVKKKAAAEQHEDHVIKVDRAKELEKCIMFDMTADGIKIYGCAYRTYKDKETGEEKGIVSFPSRKGSDDNWYNYVYFYVTPADLESIEKQIEELI